MMAAGFAAELLKLRKRPATWVLGAIWLAFPSFAGIGAPIALSLGAQTVGSEYSWGTLKTVLSQRPGRISAFLAKMLALAALLALFVLPAFVVGAVCSLVVAGLQDAPVEWPPLAELLEALAAAGIILATWAALGVFLASLFQSTALAIGLGLFYALALEGIVLSLPIPNETFQDARKFFLGQNSGFLANSFANDALPQSIASARSDVDPAQAALVLCAYIAVFVVVAALVFRRRDVTS